MCGDVIKAKDVKIYEIEPGMVKCPICGAFSYIKHQQLKKVLDEVGCIFIVETAEKFGQNQRLLEEIEPVPNGRLCKREEFKIRLHNRKK